MATARRPRILLGNLGPIMRMGMRRVLTEHGCEVVGQEDRPSAIVGEVHRLRPDVVVLDLDGGPAPQLGRPGPGAVPESPRGLCALPAAGRPSGGAGWWPERPWRPPWSGGRGRGTSGR